jgi:hypothetical protein
LDTNQIPMFRLLGTPENDKRHVLFEGGHFAPPQQDIKETLDWFDRYLVPWVGRAIARPRSQPAARRLEGGCGQD